MGDTWINQLHYGDNLEVLRDKIRDESVDLIYLDPPFNSQRNYNLLFKQVKGDAAPAQIMAFEDTWEWSPRLYSEFMDDMRNAKLFDLVDALYKILGDSEMMAYVVMMAPRLLELHRKLRPTGTLFLHCDPVASHYLKIILDVVFGPKHFRNEIVWKRSSAHSDTKQGMKRCGKIHDVVMFYAKGDDHQWIPQYVPFSEEYLEGFYRYVDENGRRYRIDNITAAKPGGDVSYEWRVKRPLGALTWVADLDDEWERPHEGWEYKSALPYTGRYWAYSKANMRRFAEEGRLYHSSTGIPCYKRYLDEMPGVPLQDIWSDIVPPGKVERRGYPTQKPLALLERIISAVTNEGEVVLDPFCGCGTAVVAAQRMGRKWIGIDVTYLAIAEIVYRLSTETEAKRDVDYELIGSPKDEMSARKFFEQTAPQNHKPFEMWGVQLVEGEPQEKKGGDKGVDGRIPFRGLDKKLRWGLIQVKGGATGPSHIRDFARTLDRDNALLGLFICFEYTKEMREEAEKMGNAETIGGSRKVPRLQIMTIKELLEDKRRFEIPEGWRLPRTKGVAKAGISSQTAFELAESGGEGPDPFEDE